MTKLMIVESAAKARTIQKYLGSGWQVLACLGHVRDLPKKALGVDVDADFRPTYEVTAGKAKLVKRLVKAIREVDEVYVATDPDREGEAIAWHVLKVADVAADKRVYRVSFNAITSAVVKAAIASPRPLDINLIEAQSTRRIIDRLVGYLASPLACKALDGSYSAGRVQSACLRLILERERAIQAFVPEGYHTLALQLRSEEGEFSADLHRIKGADARFTERGQLDKLVRLLKVAQFRVADVTRKLQIRQPPAPFTTSTLQQVASRALGWSPDHVMAVAQTLYEAGLITYPRTDGLFIAPEAEVAARATIDMQAGADYLPDQAPVYGTQGAHEAIRPVDVGRCAMPAKPTQSAEAEKLYALIWRRFVASQMAAARFAVTTATVIALKPDDRPYPLVFRAVGRACVFDGYQKVYQDLDAEDEAETKPVTLPQLTAKGPLMLVEALIADKQTQPPHRFSEAGLVAELERVGVGRPSTYAGIVRAVQVRGYIRLDRKRLVLTETGERLLDYLNEYFPQVFDVDYTATLEADLDRIADGGRSRLDVLRDFWRAFQPRLASAAISTPKRSLPQSIGEACPQCDDGGLVKRHGTNGVFIGCDNFPRCTYTRDMDTKPLLLHPARGGDG